ncbi:tyrosine-type recombinase/integrase [Paraglaciecola sp. 25GB23A]|uniref:tyrosine-type recombinase/integrase n=1 Tax=Paraglaciecola sp. 25GB23A TaxID=3156068 RepID=UPI0032AEA4D0
MAVSSDTKYLKKRKNRDVWLFSMRIPSTIQHLYEGKAVYTKSLQTACVKTARLRRDQLLAQISHQKEQAIDGGRSTFISFYNTLTEAKNVYGGADLFAPYNQLDTSILVGTECHPDIQRDAKRAVDEGCIPVQYSYTLREAMNDWLVNNQRKNRDTLSKVKSTTQRFLRFCNKHDIPLITIDRLTVVGFIEELIEDYSPSTVSGYISRLKTMYKYAWSMGKINKKENPFESHSFAHYGKETVTAKKQLFNRNQVRQIIAWAKGETDNINVLVNLGLYTGCRIGELCNLTSEDVHQEGNMMALYIRNGKTPAAERTVPLPKVLHQLIRERLLKIAYTGETLIGLPTKTASRVFSDFKVENISKKSDLCFHSFRVHASTAYGRARVNEQTASFIIGHSGDSKTMTYGYYLKADELKELAAATEAAAIIIERDWL